MLLRHCCWCGPGLRRGLLLRWSSVGLRAGSRACVCVSVCVCVSPAKMAETIVWYLLSLLWPFPFPSPSSLLLFLYPLQGMRGSRGPPRINFEILDSCKWALVHSGMLKWFRNVCVFRSQCQLDVGMMNI